MIDVARELSKHFDAAALGCERVRFDGAELPLVAPDSLAGFVEAVRFAAREKLALVPIGLGSKLGWLRAPERADFLLSTRRFAGVVSHVPDDGTIAVRAGTRMDELREITRRGGHFLTPDVSHPAAKTIGGVIAAGESGADRLRFGPVRHHVLGLKVVLADGSVAKCGGQLVKNVTGFDLMRLYTGSHGSLCVIVEAALRLFPEPARELWLEAHPADERDALELARRALGLPMRFTSLSVGANARGSFLAARLFARRDVIDSQRESLMAAWPKLDVYADAEARAIAESRRDAFVDDGQSPLLHVACVPSRLPQLLEKLDLVIDRSSMRLEPGVATLEVALDEPLASSAGHVREVVGELVELRFDVSLRNFASAELDADPAFAAGLPGLELMRALKAQLDPLGVFARGRLHREL